GPGGTGKSFLMLLLAMQHALGLNLLGHGSFGPAVPVAGKCMSFTAEDDREDVWRRLEAISNAYMLNDEQKASIAQGLSVKCTRGQDWRLVEDVGGILVTSKTANMIVDQLRKEVDLSLIMFDPSALFAGVDENDNAAASAYMRALDYIAKELNCAV